jgi:hypothetical protein
MLLQVTAEGSWGLPRVVFSMGSAVTAGRSVRQDTFGKQE